MGLVLAAVYPLLYTLGWTLYLPVYLWRRATGRRDSLALSGRIASLSALQRIVPKKRLPRIWIQAVSVGEVRSIAPLVRSFNSGGADVVVSTTTPTGQAVARQSLGKDTPVFYFPFDWRWLCRRYQRAIDPDLILLAESELWPGFLAAAKSLEIPVMLVNGRISDKSFHRYQRLRFWVRPLLRSLERLCMQTPQDVQRALALGAPSAKTIRTGNLKYDYRAPDDADRQRLVNDLGKRLKPEAKSLLWIWGSTREGEESLLLPAYLELLSDFPSLRILVAPRHPHRGREVATLFEENGVPAELRSGGTGGTPISTQSAGFALVLDTVGELASLYEIGDLVFIGGSLVPWGGHNLIEAAYFAKPIIFGPNMQNFQEITNTFLESYGALQVQDSDELALKVRDLLRDPTARQWLGRNARKVVRDNQGALEKTVRIIQRCMSVQEVQ